MSYLLDTNVLLRSIQHTHVKITHILTFNTDDFKRYDEITVVSPSSL